MTAAESEVDQAAEDTRCQSSLLKSRRNQNAPSSMFNMESQILSFRQKSQIFSVQKTQQNLNRRVKKLGEKKVILEACKADTARTQFGPVPGCL